MNASEQMMPNTPAAVLSQTIPYRLDLCGGWLDQPYVSSLYPGNVINVAIEPQDFAGRSGMSSSTRGTILRHGVETWDEAGAKAIFESELLHAGSQDAIGIVMPGIKSSYYAGRRWPEHVLPVRDKWSCEFIEGCVSLLHVGERHKEFSPLEHSRITVDGARRLAQASTECWGAFVAADITAFGRAMTEGFHAQLAMFPGMKDSRVAAAIERVGRKALGYKVAGAGGGGYVVFISEEPIEGAARIKVRR